MKDKKTIAITINTSWNVYNFRLGLLKALQDDGYKIVVIAPYDYHTQKLVEQRFDYHDIKINNKGINPIEEIKLIMQFYKIYKEIKPDILLHYTIKPNIFGTIAASFLKIPVISNISGLGTVFINSNSLSSVIARKLYKVAMRIPKKVFFQNVHDRDVFINSKLVKKEETGLLAGSGVNIERFKPVEDNMRQANELHFLFIARLIGDKGLVEYVDAARMLKAKYPKAKFAVLGTFYLGNPTAITHDEIETWVDEGIIDYLGSSEKVEQVIADYDCLVLPSYREGLSRVLLEGASMAKPIVTTNVPGCKCVIDHGISGYLCNVKDADSLAEQMEKMILLTDEERQEMGKNGREKIITQFDEKFVIEKYRETIENLLSSSDR